MGSNNIASEALVFRIMFVPKRCIHDSISAYNNEQLLIDAIKFVSKRIQMFPFNGWYQMPTSPFLLPRWSQIPNLYARRFPTWVACIKVFYRASDWGNYVWDTVRNGWVWDSKQQIWIKVKMPPESHILWYLVVSACVGATERSRVHVGRVRIRCSQAFYPSGSANSAGPVYEGKTPTSLSAGHAPARRTWMHGVSHKGNG